MMALTYEFGYTINTKSESRDQVLKVIGEADFDQYTALAKNENWKETHLPDVKGVYRKPSLALTTTTTYWVRPVLITQLPLN